MTKKNSPIVRTRKISREVDRQLYTFAGGRCEFDGCNKYLLKHHLTHIPGNFAEKAHICAFSEAGPRGKDETRPTEDINEIENLMLLCPDCHKLIDDNAERFDVATLRRHKIDHESRIHYLTGFDKDRKATILQVLSKIAGQPASVSMADVMNAVAPRYPEDTQGVVINLNQLDDSAPSFLASACDVIDKRLKTLYDECHDGTRCGHVSVFALAPIPVLIYLGTKLSSKIPTDIFQRHRDMENWTWKTEGPTVRYSLRCLQTGSNPHNAALTLSLSGNIEQSQLPAAIDESFSIYEITLQDLTPSPTFLRQKADLEAFRLQYQIGLRTIARAHPGLNQLHVFPAVPAPVAVLIGRELLPKVDPELVVYDNRRAEGGFVHSIIIRTN